MENTEEIVKTNSIVPNKIVYDPNTYNYYDENMNKQILDKINNRHNDDINTIINKEFNNNVDIDEEYITIDPFNKLNKYQTIYTISKNDISEIPQYDSIKQYLCERERQLLIPLEKQESQQILKNEELEQQKISQNKQLVVNNKKSKKLLSNLLYSRFNWKKYFPFPKY